MEICSLKVDIINTLFWGEIHANTNNFFSFLHFIITDLACIAHTALNGAFYMWKTTIFDAFHVKAWIIILFPLQRKKMGRFLSQLWLICVWRTDVLTLQILKWGHHLNISNSVWHSSTSTLSGGVSGASHKMMSCYESKALLGFSLRSPLISSCRGVDTLSFVKCDVISGHFLNILPLKYWKYLLVWM